MRIKTLEEYIEMLRKEDLLVSSEGIDTGALAGAGSEVQIKDVSYNRKKGDLYPEECPF